jgi:tetraacyldisaccharide 4'-kinase
MRTGREAMRTGREAMRTALVSTPGAAVRWVRTLWYAPKPTVAQRVFRRLLRVPAGLFGWIVSIRNQSFDVGLRRISRVGMPVISVGNLSVGGTGKTPLTGWLVARLVARGELPAVLSRGYGADELALHRRWHPGVPVYADRDRVALAQRALDAGATCGLLDDGFQHRSLARDADLVVLAAEDPLPIALLPAGPYREPLRSLRRASAVVVTSRGEHQSAAVSRWMEVVRALPQHPPVIHVPMRAQGWIGLASEPVDPPPREGPLNALLSIGRPESFAPLVETLVPDAGVRLRLLVFPDHHDYTTRDLTVVLEAMAGDRLLTTEKDAVKLLPFADLLARRGVRVWVLRMSIDVDGQAARILDHVLDRVLALGRDPGA